MASETEIMQSFYDHVPILEDKDFGADNKLELKDTENILKGVPKRRVVVMIYADWCPHCVHTKPKAVEAVKTLLASKDPADSDILIAAIPLAGDDVDDKLKTRVQSIFPKWSGGIPYIGLIKDGVPVKELEGDRSAQNILALARS